MQASKSSRRAIVIVTAVMLAVVGAVVKQQRRHRVLPDGSRLHIEQIVYSTNWNCRYFWGTPWQRMVQKYVPLQWRAKLGVKNPGSGGFLFAGTGATNLFILTRQRVGSIKNPIELERIHVVDTDGAVFEATPDAITGRRPDEVVQGWRFRAFRRRSKTVRLRFVYKENEDRYATAAECEILNPAHADYPVWTPEPVPAIKQSGDLKVTLVDFVAGLHHEQEAEPKYRWYWISRSTTRLVFDVQQGGHEHHSWLLKSVQLSDATGNSWTPSLEGIIPNPPPPGQLFGEFIGALWPSEPAWKVLAEFSRTSDFLAEELWTSADIVVPATNQLTMLRGYSPTNGVELVAIGGAGAEMPERFSSIAQSGKVNLVVQTRMQEIKRVTLTKVIDDQGRLVVFGERYPWSETEHSFALEVPSGTKAIKATFAIHPSRLIEFVARPRQESPQNTSSTE
jgi:hypothetical protein